MKLLQIILNALTFRKSKTKTNIPKEVIAKTQSLHHSEKAAALKVVNFAKRHFIEQEDLLELFDAELEYESKKYQARQDFPHQPAIRKSDIALAKKHKYERLKQNMSSESYEKYRFYRERQHKRNPKKN